MLYLKGAKARFKTTERFNVDQDIKEGEIKLLTGSSEVMTVDFIEYSVSAVDSNNNIYESDEISELEDTQYIDMEWSGGLSYFSLNNVKLYQENAQNCMFANLPAIKGISELSYNIDDQKYDNGDLLEAIGFKLMFEDMNGNIKILDVI